jgi:hypothetical protein
MTYAYTVDSYFRARHDHSLFGMPLNGLNIPVVTPQLDFTLLCPEVPHFDETVVGACGKLAVRRSKAALSRCQLHSNGDRG